MQMPSEYEQLDVFNLTGPVQENAREFFLRESHNCLVPRDNSFTRPHPARSSNSNVAHDVICDVKHTKENNVDNSFMWLTGRTTNS